MMSDSPYPGDDWFLDEMKREVVHVSKMMNSHPSLALWSGNNENEQVKFRGNFMTARRFETGF